MKVVLFQQHKFELWNPPPWVAQRLRERFPQVGVVHPATPDDLVEELHDAEVAIGATLPAALLPSFPRLKWVHSPAAAVHLFMVPEFIASSITLTNGRSTFAAPVAEHVMGQILALARQIPACVRFQMQRTWGQQLLWDARPRPRELQGATLGLIGLGAIGVEVVKRAKAFGMTVIAVREHPENVADGVSKVYGTQDLDQLLAQSDFVLLAAPVTPSTKHLINAERLGQMKPGAYLINVGRGALIDESALVKALQIKQIAGAALDVFAEEPLAADSPLWAMENLLITPHCAGFIENLWERHLELISENLHRYLDGRPLLGLVDKASGY